MSEPTELDRRIEALRAEVRRALLGGDRARAQALRRDLREAERAWHDSLAELDADPADELGWQGGAAPDGGAGRRDGPTARLTGGAAPDSRAGRRDEPNGRPPGGAAPGALLLPLREQVHQALILLTVPAGPRMISAVHAAMFTGSVPAARLTSLRRDEERSFRTAPFARPYYLCAALTADLLAPARGLLAISTWPMHRRIIGPLSPRVDYLTAAVSIAEHVQRMPAPSGAALRLLWRFAANIPGATATGWQAAPADVAEAARAELEVHAEADEKIRRSSAMRARRQLDDAQQLFGSRLTRHRQTGAGSGQHRSPA